MEYIIEKNPVPSSRAKEIVFEKTKQSVLYKENGKPYIKDAFISISHSRDFVLVGFNSFPIGVDIEILRPYDKRLIDRYFSEAEKAFIKCDTDFFTVWTVKEAYLKLTGEGLKGIKKISVIKSNEIYIEGYHILSFIENDCAIAIVYE